MARLSAGICVAAALLATAGCSVKRFAINKLGDSLANSGTTYAADDDPDLVGQALPFSLKLVEGLLAESPQHRGLLFTAASGFTEYAYAYVQQDADMAENESLDKAAALRARARRLYVRARDYGLRGLDARYRTFSRELQRDPKAAVRVTGKADVPLLYWIFISYEPARQGVPGDPLARSRMHFDRVVALTHGQLASPFVSLAETVSVQHQDRAEFESLLKRALMVDADARPEWRLQNLIVQRRARWLLAREDDLFAK